jgi:MFS family permease
MFFKNFKNLWSIKEARIVAFLFMASSLLFGIWVAAIPTIKQRLGFNDASLGLSLFLAPCGALTGVALSAKIFSKIPVGKWMWRGYIIHCLSFILLINSPNRLVFWVCLYVFGLMGFLNGVSTNSTVNILSVKHNKNIMSTCHGMYSLGGAISSGLAFLFFSVNVVSGWQIIIVAAIIACIILVNIKMLESHHQILHTSSRLQFPSPTIIGISFICMISFMAEGCVADWSGIYLKESLHSAKNLVSLGYAGFAIAMTIGRLNGDSIISRFGGKKIIIAGEIIASAGFLIVALAPGVFTAIAGYVLVGFGCCCIVPVLFSASARIPGVSTVEGFAMVTTGGLLGFLTGPSIIGFISKSYSLSAGMALLSVLMLVALFVAMRNKFLN